jgi:hypothetical protein
LISLVGGTGFVTSWVDQVVKANCEVIAGDVNEPILEMAKKNTLIEWRLAALQPADRPGLSAEGGLPAILGV